MINRILAEWNPIGVGYELAIDEYRDYIPVILQFCHDKKKLINYLQNILVNEMGLEYDGRNKKLDYRFNGGGHCRGNPADDSPTGECL